MTKDESNVRIDKWLWAARFFKTRSAAQAAIEGGKVKLNGERTKPAKELKTGDRLSIHIGLYDWDVTVLKLSSQRGSAPVARLLYEEDEASRLAREDAIAKRRVTFEPALARKGEGRPTKRDRRDLDRWNDPE
ncbi:MAG TPA: RNA-binding S4 domain-containing protein [Burkholderiales bacterium]|nr:RNA-binding S4 domain-containing protein [Burkholderiales bacterium]